MSVTKSTERSSTSTNGHVAKRLAAYTAAATGAALAASAADAGVVVVNIATQQVNSSFSIDLSAAGTNGGAYTFFNWVTGPNVFYGRIDANPLPDNQQFVGGVAVGYGLPIGPAWAAGWYSGAKAWNQPGNGVPTTIYVAFKLTVVSGASTANRYGWIEYVNNGVTKTVSRWAYESQLNTAIAAGVTPAAVPGGAGLAALAVGAAGVRGRRRSRN